MLEKEELPVHLRKQEAMVVMLGDTAVCFSRWLKPRFRFHSIAHMHQILPQMGKVYGSERKKLKKQRQKH